MEIFYPEDKLPQKGIDLGHLIGSEWKGKLKNYNPSIFEKPMIEDGNGFSYLTQAIKEQLGDLSNEISLSHNQVVGLWLDRYLKEK